MDRDLVVGLKRWDALMRDRCCTYTPFCRERVFWGSQYSNTGEARVSLWEVADSLIVELEVNGWRELSEVNKERFEW